MRRLALLIFALTPGLAAAAPLVAVLGAEVIVGLGITWGTVIFTAATIIYGQAQQRKQKKEAARQAQAGRESFNANLRDRTISGVATEFNYRTIYGRARVGGNVVAIFKSGARDEYKHIIVQLAPHECDAIEDVYIAALKVGPLDSNGVPTSGNFSGTEAVNEAQEFIAGAVKILTYEPINGTISVIGHKLSTNDERPNLFFTNTPIPFFMVSTQVIAEDAGYSTVTVNYQWLKNLSPVRITKHLGGMTDPADAQTVADTGGVWNNNCVLRGHTYLAIRLNLNQPEFQNGLPSIEAVIRAAKMVQ